jgi:hypothetical protein
MIFILLLIASTMAIAGSAAYFSVYGLANTFSGVFWSVVIMGASLEAGKLIAASYLYRYWKETNFALKAYLMAGITALMLLTSLGIFGYLSSGYQQDVLPLKQKTEQIALLEDEKGRALGGPAVVAFNKMNGEIDVNAARVLRETTRSRDQLVRQYRAEQETVTKRITELDTQLLALKQDVIKTEAHIGPITYVAKVFNQSTDDATKWLVLIIIFAFDPMAVALTLAVNIALRLRREEKEKSKPAALPPFTPPQPMPPAPAPSPEKYAVEDQRGVLDGVDYSDGNPGVEKYAVEDARGSLNHIDYDAKSEPVKHAVEYPRGSLDHLEYDHVPPDSVLPDPDLDVDLELDMEPAPEAPPAAPAVEEPVEDPATAAGRRFRPYPGSRWTGDGSVLPEKMRELINHHKFLKAKQDNGDSLNREESWELLQIEEILRKNGIDMYL